MIKDCTCDGTIFTDKMCNPCLRATEERLERRTDSLQEKLDELESNIERVRTYLYN